MNTESKANAAFTSITLRGGRVTKWKGQVASCAPQVGHLQNVSVAAMAAALAFGGAMAIPSDALAQNVTVVVDSGAPAPIDQVNSGTGALIINATVPVEGAFRGIFAKNESTATNLFITATDVQGGIDGIYADNAGTGTTFITTTGNVVGVAGGGSTGIEVINRASAGALANGDALTIDANNVTGAAFGISATNFGAGSTLVTTSGNVTGTSNIGIQVSNRGSSNNVVVEANGNVTGGGDDGIDVENFGSGSTSIKVTGIVDGRNDGIEAFNAPSSSDLTIDANIVTGALAGIRAGNQGSGVTSVTTSGDVTGGNVGISVTSAGTGTTIIKATGDVVGTANAGIDVSNGSGAGVGVTGDALTVDVGYVKGGTYGILATNNGAGSTSITATGNVTGTAYDGIKVVNEVLANNLTVETNGIVTGRDDGIETLNSGLGSTSITAKGTVEGGANGIDAVNTGTAKDISITAASVIGNLNGVYARNSGLGSVSVTTSGNVEALGGNGVTAIAGSSAQDISVKVNTVTGETGIVLLNSGNGSISLDADGRVLGLNGNGINVKTDASAKDISLTVRTVEGSNNGIYAIVEGEGDLDIEATGTVTGGVNGIQAEITDAALGGSIHIDVVDVTGGADGINASNFGTGTTTIKSTGAITGTTDVGVFVINGAAGGVATTGDLVLELNDVTGDNYGIVATNNGTGSTSITATGNVYGTDYDGIFAYNGEVATDLTIVANGIVTGGDEGIYAQNYGTGSTSITATGDVTGTDGDGIYASNGELANDLTIVAKGTVTGGIDGIEVDNDGTGSTSITTEGDVTGIEGDGIDASNGELANNLTIVANGKVTGDDEGFAVYNFGTGSTSITAEGNVTGTEGDGILASNGELANDLTIVANGIVTGDNDGIDADNKGTGSTSITATGNVTGTDEDGIEASNGELATDLTIVANGIVSGGRDGINADNSGTGSTSITATGDVTGGTFFSGIFANNDELANDLTIVANGIVTGDAFGIATTNLGAGSTSITATGDVTGTEGDGILAFNDESATDLTIVANGIVTGGNYGIYARNDGTGSTSITATGDVTGTNDDGIRAFNDKLANNVIILTNGTVTGDDSGIDVSNIGTGSTSITATGYVSGGDYGIRAEIEYGVGDLTIDADKVTGGKYGIEVRNQGAGSTRVTTSGDVTGTSEDGIRVLSFANDIIVVANGNVKGGENGIETINIGLGSTSITATGDVDGQSANGINFRSGTTAKDIVVIANKVTGAIDGINAQIEGNGLVDVTINGLVSGGVQGIDLLNLTTSVDLNASVDVSDTGSVTGAVNGINMVNIGTGATKLTSSGKVSGGTYGISVANTATGTDVTVSGGDVTGGVNGLDVDNLGTGNTFVTGTGTVTGTTGNGIDVFNAATAGSMTIAANNVIGAVNGINAQNEGNGVIDVTVTGAVTGGVYGVNATKGASTGDLTVSVNVANTGSVDGAVYGINLVNVTGGSTTLTSSGKVNGDLIGVFAVNGPDAVDLTVTAGNVTGGVYGLAAVNTGTGDTSVTVSNYASGGTKDGVRVSNVAGTGAISVTAHDVKGGINAIVANNLGTGATAITASGKVEGGTGVAILASNLAGTTATINITATADVEATSGNAILNDAGNSILNVANGATISGTIRLGDGSDTANLALASSAGFANITVLDGGDNLSAADGFVDRLNLNGAGTYELDSARLTNWEEINVNAGRVTFSNAAITTGTLGINQGGTLNGTNNLLVTANVITATGGTLLAGNANGNAATRIVGNLTNGGLVDLSGATAKVGDTLTINGNYTGAGGQIRFDTVVNGDNSPTDFVLVTGNVGGTSQIVINNVGGVGGATVGDGIKLVQVDGTSTAAAFALADDLQVGGFRYDVFVGGVADPDDQDWYLRTVGLSDIAATTLSLARLGDDISMTFLGTLHERVGEQEHLAKRGYQNGGVSGLWGRFIGKGFRERLASKDLGEVKSNGSITGMQLGLDFVRKINRNGSATFAGAYSGYADGSSSDTNIFQDVARRAGGSKSKGWLAGLYGTHYGATGWYANAAVQASFLDAAANAANGTTLRTDARTLLGSLEMGKSLKLGGRMAFEPQFQVIYSNNKFDGAVDSAGTLNEVAIEDSIIGRAGFRLKTTKDEKFNADGGLFSGYLKANLWHNFLGADIALTSAGQAVGKFEPKKTWVDVGVGTTLTVAKQTEIFFDADVEFGIDQKTTAGTGKVGLRFNW